MIKKLQMRFGFLHDFLKGVSVSAFFVSIFLQLSVSLAIADDGLRGPVTWVKPDPKTGTLKLDTNQNGKVLSVTDPETGEDLNTPQKLHDHGWTITPDGYLKSNLDGFIKSDLATGGFVEMASLYASRSKIYIQASSRLRYSILISRLAPTPTMFGGTMAMPYLINKIP